MTGLGWAAWLGVPLVVTLLVACVLWWRGRPPRALTSGQAVRAHQDYLQALESPVPASSYRVVPAMSDGQGVERPD